MAGGQLPIYCGDCGKLFVANVVVGDTTTHIPVLCPLCMSKMKIGSSDFADDAPYRPDVQEVVDCFHETLNDHERRLTALERSAHGSPINERE